MSSTAKTMSSTGKTAHPGKTNAARQLDALCIAYELRSYEVDPDDLTAISVARKIGLPAEQVFKTLVTRTHDGEHLFAVVPGDAELDLKKLAAVAGTRKVELAALKDVEPLTGYVRGGVTVQHAFEASDAPWAAHVVIDGKLTEQRDRHGIGAVALLGLGKKRTLDLRRTQGDIADNAAACGILDHIDA